jgi:hypothetical protein
MTLDLRALEKKLDDVLAKETPESLRRHAEEIHELFLAYEQYGDLYADTILRREP